ncbi:putative lipid II flippase FtsW [Gayadomonas joobiniege]|uniref:putative lipid II flippase FtsW n=1 Tax=Gayadomonas joobiniege TaxID=1234606 RepID=UPI00037EED94|nr:putative lipid II flippase FtsW [Gayadomonas joobiniege]
MQAEQSLTKYPSLLERLFTGALPVYKQAVVYDRTLLCLILALSVLGIIMVASASIPYANTTFENPMHFVYRHLAYLAMSLVGVLIVVQIPTYWWLKTGGYLLILSLALLIAVLIIGKSVNGATRWIPLGPFNLQVAELAKLLLFVYLSGYLVRHQHDVQNKTKGFIKPLAVFLCMAVLLLCQPDLGTLIVMFATTLGLLFLAGAKVVQFFFMFLAGLIAIVSLIVFEPYRMRRILSFMNPWEDPFGAGYQLTQSLMAYGRGDWFGVGLGNSIQKLNYLPEAHTDFIFAILAEELGYFGVAVTTLLLLAVVVRVIRIGGKAMHQEKPFLAYLAYGIAIWTSIQTAVNIGASAGLFPTKGLTLPFISYGGSSLLVMSCAMAIVLRIDFELRMQRCQAIEGYGGKRHG